MNIEQQIARMFSEDTDRPDCEQLMIEIAQIKQQLSSLAERLGPTAPVRSQKIERAYYRFTKTLRSRLSALARKGESISLFYQDRTLGIDADGYLYDKKTAENLPTYQAFEAYRFWYDHREELYRYTDAAPDLSYELNASVG